MAQHGHQACFSAVTANHWGSIQLWDHGRAAIRPCKLITLSVSEQTS